MNKDFAIFILTHGRAEKVTTYNTLRKSNVKDRIYLIVDDEDEQKNKYIEKFGEKNVILFSKKEIGKEFDIMDNLKDNRVVVFARNASFKIAQNLGIKYFLVLDDDYKVFYYVFVQGKKLKRVKITKLQEVFNEMLIFYKKTPFKSIAMAQTGDFCGGAKGGFIKSRKRIRKVMNSFFCSTERPFKFIGRINEDVNAYINEARSGGLFLTIPFLAVNQKKTQSNSGGLTGIYLKLGTYVKSFYTVMISPSSVKVNMMGIKEKRLHHKVEPDNTYQEIIREN